MVVTGNFHFSFVQWGFCGFMVQLGCGGQERTIGKSGSPLSRELDLRGRRALLIKLEIYTHTHATHFPTSLTSVQLVNRKEQSEVYIWGHTYSNEEYPSHTLCRTAYKSTKWRPDLAKSMEKRKGEADTNQSTLSSEHTQWYTWHAPGWRAKRH